MQKFVIIIKGNNIFLQMEISLKIHCQKDMDYLYVSAPVVLWPRIVLVGHILQLVDHD